MHLSISLGRQFVIDKLRHWDYRITCYTLYNRQQWRLIEATVNSNPEIIRTEESTPISEVSSFQGVQIREVPLYMYDRYCVHTPDKDRSNGS